MDIDYFDVLNADFVVKVFISLASGRNLVVYSYNVVNAKHDISQVGHMIQAESDPQKRDEYLQRLMELPNQVLLSSF